MAEKSMQEGISSQSMVELIVTSDVNSFYSQRRFQKDVKIRDLKGHVELLTGANVLTMELQLLNDEKQVVTKLSDDSAILSSYSLDKVVYLHVLDSSLKPGEFEDISNVERFEISNEKYEKMSDTFREFKKKLQIKEEDDAQKEIFSVGKKCWVAPKKSLDKPKRSGTIMYFGKIGIKTGSWVGVKYDDPVGKNDGSLEGERYFECEPNYGSFVRPDDIMIDHSDDVIDCSDEML